MYTYSYMPQRNAKKASFIVTVCFLLGFGLMYFANFVSYRYILQILGIAAFAIGIFMTTRYIIRRYAYSIQKSGDGDYDFVVNQVQGKRSTVVCRVNMDEICAFYPDDGTRIRLLPESGRRRLFYRSGAERGQCGGQIFTRREDGGNHRVAAPEKDGNRFGRKIICEKLLTKEANTGILNKYGFCNRRPC